MNHHIRLLAEQLAANLKGRPVAVVWSKADEIVNIRENIKRALGEDLAHVFGNSQVFEVSNFPKPIPDTLCHENNPAVVEYLLGKLNEPKIIRLMPQVSTSDDLLFNYKGSYGIE